MLRHVNEAMMYFSRKIKILRRQRGLTQQQLANRLGVSKATISAYETDAKYPSIEGLIRICDFFDVSADYLLGRNDMPDLLKTGLTDEQQELILELTRQFQDLNQSAKE